MCVCRPAKEFGGPSQLFSFRQLILYTDDHISFIVCLRWNFRPLFSSTWLWSGRGGRPLAPFSSPHSSPFFFILVSLSFSYSGDPKTLHGTWRHTSGWDEMYCTRLFWSECYIILVLFLYNNPAPVYRSTAADRQVRRAGVGWNWEKKKPCPLLFRFGQGLALCCAQDLSQINCAWTINESQRVKHRKKRIIEITFIVCLAVYQRIRDYKSSPVFTIFSWEF